MENTKDRGPFDGFLKVILPSHGCQNRRAIYLPGYNGGNEKSFAPKNFSVELEPVAEPKTDYKEKHKAISERNERVERTVWIGVSRMR